MRCRSRAWCAIRKWRPAGGGKLELLVERVLADGTVAAHMRASKKPPVGARLRVRGQLRSGLAGPVMLHPAVRAAGAPLPARAARFAR